MSITTLTQNNNFTIKINKRFDFAINEEFLASFQSVESAANFIIDLSSCEYMDSSALGMLLQLREFVNKDKSKLQIIQCSKEIKKTLKLAGFDSIFKVS